MELENYKYQKQLSALRQRKLKQVQEKIEKEGPLNEDDYGRIVPPEKKRWIPIPNHPDGHFYGIEGWCQNFTDLMCKHPLYIDADDAFAGRWMYFMSRMTNKWNPDYPYAHLLSDIEKYNIICGIGDDAHFAPDYEIGLKLGWKGLLNKISYYEDVYKNDKEKRAFYNCHRKVIVAIQTWIQHHIDAIRSMVITETSQEKKQNLLEMLEANCNILNNPPANLREACQWIIWYHLASRTYNRDGAGGQLDTLLQPYYEHDLHEGCIDRDKAIYYLACLLINDPVYWQLGGPDEKGNDQTSEISFLILEAADKINTSINITIRVHPGLNKELFRTSLRYLIKNKNAWPRYSGDKALVEGFMRNGFSIELARKRIAVGCNWMSLPGLEYTMNDLVKINMPKVFEVALSEMRKKYSLRYFSIRLLWDIFREHLKMAVHIASECIRFHLKYQKYNEPELILNLLSHGPLEKGKDVSDGGAEYYNLAIDGAGLATTADSFIAIEQRIEIEQEITWEQLLDALDDNFVSNKNIRIQALLRNSCKFGQEISLADKWAKKCASAFTGLVRSESEKSAGYLFIPGFFSWANTLEFGQAVGATPDGRKRYEPISHGANPTPGFSNDFASLLQARAVAMIQPGFGNTAPMQWEVDLSFIKDKEEEYLENIIQTHFEAGGTLININIVDEKKIMEAHKAPTLYPDLVVRVTGFTAYFSMLTPQFRQLVIDRLCRN